MNFEALEMGFEALEMNFGTFKMGFEAGHGWQGLRCSSPPNPRCVSLATIFFSLIWCSCSHFYFFAFFLN
jgi:hypothetical protein